MVYLLFCYNKPDLRLRLGTVSVEVLYIFGDASRLGFGDLWTEEDSVEFRLGVWNEEVDVTSSNYREF